MGYENPSQHRFQTPKVTEIKRLGFLAYAQTLNSLPDNVFIHPATFEPDGGPDDEPQQDALAA